MLLLLLLFIPLVRIFTISTFLSNNSELITLNRKKIKFTALSTSIIDLALSLTIYILFALIYNNFKFLQQASLISNPRFNKSIGLYYKPMSLPLQSSIGISLNTLPFNAITKGLFTFYIVLNLNFYLKLIINSGIFKIFIALFGLYLSYVCGLTNPTITWIISILLIIYYLDSFYVKFKFNLENWITGLTVLILTFTCLGISWYLIYFAFGYALDLTTILPSSLGLGFIVSYEVCMNPGDPGPNPGSTGGEGGSSGGGGGPSGPGGAGPGEYGYCMESGHIRVDKLSFSDYKKKHTCDLTEEQLQKKRESQNISNKKFRENNPEKNKIYKARYLEKKRLSNAKHCVENKPLIVDKQSKVKLSSDKHRKINIVSWDAHLNNLRNNPNFK